MGITEREAAQYLRAKLQTASSLGTMGRWHKQAVQFIAVVCPQIETGAGDGLAPITVSECAQIIAEIATGARA